MHYSTKNGPVKDLERIKTTSLTGLITLKADKHKYKKEEGYQTISAIKIHSEIFSSVIPGNVNKISKITTNTDTLSELGNKIKTTNQIVKIQLLCKNNKYNKINQPNRTSERDNEIPLHVDSIHPSFTIKCRYPKSTWIQSNQPTPDTVEFKYNQTESVVTRVNEIAKEIDISVPKIDTAKIS